MKIVNNPKPARYVKDLSNSDYHSRDEYLSSSQLKFAKLDPYNFQKNILDKEKEEETKEWRIDNDLDWGTVAHTLILEPEHADRDILVINRKEYKRGKNTDHKAIRELKELPENSGKCLISLEQYKRILKVRDTALKENKLFKQFFEEEKGCELSGFATCPKTGINIRWRPDARPVKSPILWDVKTTRKIFIDQFRREAYDRGYHISAAHYLHGESLVHGEEREWGFIGVCNKESGRIYCYKASEDFMNKAHLDFWMCMNNVQRALDSEGVIPYQSEYIYV